MPLHVCELSWAALHSFVVNKTRGRHCRVDFPRLSDSLHTHWTLQQVGEQSTVADSSQSSKMTANLVAFSQTQFA